MVRQKMVRAALVALAALGSVVGLGQQPASEAPATTELGGADRALTAVSTDKPVYKEGETVYVRAVALRALDRQPAFAHDGTAATFQVRGPKGEILASGVGVLKDAVAAFRWEIPSGQAGGEHTLVVAWPNEGWAPAERAFDVRAYRAPRLKTQIEFVKDGYGPGETVRATLKVERPEGGAPVGAEVAITARVDGAEAYRGSATVGADGLAEARFPLPRSIERGEGTLAMTVTDGGVVETATKTIPILVQTVDLQIFPEGGDLVAGLPCRLYFEGRQPNGKPADMDGVVVDSTGSEVARFQSGHDGRGVFGLVPAPGESYELVVTRPAGIRKTWALPATRASGAVLRSLNEVTEPGDAVVLEVGSTRGQTVVVTLSRREVEVARGRVPLGAGEVTKVLVDPGAADGVLIATVWDENGRPLAERLVFRRPAKALSLEVKADKSRTVPGAEVEVTITAREGGRPVEAVVGVTVTDDAVLEMVDKRDQAPRLPVMVLLEPEVRELADAHVYLDPTNPEADSAVDLLLGTQGWRRFAFAHPRDFLAEHGDPARRVLAMRERRIDIRTVSTTGVFFQLNAVAASGPLGDAEGLKVAENEDEDREEAGEVADKDMGGAPKVQVQPAKPAKPDDAKAPDVVAMNKVGVARQDPGPRRAAGAPAPLRNQKQEMRKNLEARARPVVAADEPIMIDDGIRGGGRTGPAWTREYAHVARPDRRPGERVDFAETRYWAAGVRTDPTTGQATIRFATSDAVTGFRVLADAFSTTGALGQGTALIESVEPFHAEPKLPLHVTQGDTVRLPVALSNGTGAPLEGATIAVTLGGATGPTVAPFALEPGGGARRLLDLEITQPVGTLPITVVAAAGDYVDRQERTIAVEANGFPQDVGFGGLLEPGSAVVRTVAISDGLVPGSLAATIEVHPTPLASLTSAFERLIQEPYGCFEQTSSTTYPLVMAQQYFTSHAGVDPDLIKRSAGLLTKGYERLRGFECKKKGYEWFGEDPGHEALTAFGLLEFTDMAAVRSVDTDMLERTRGWLLGQRDGKGGFKRERRALHTWIEDRDASNAYIVWALVSTGGKEGLEDEILALEDAALGSKDAYVWGLTANALQLSGRGEAARPLLDRLAKAQDDAGMITGGQHSIVGSSGEALAVETTAFATLAFLRSPAHQDNVESAVRWLADVCKGGRFGSTQSTVLALQAIVAYDKARARPKAPGTVRLLVDGEVVGTAPFDADEKGAISLPGLADHLSPGRHEVRVELEGGGPMPLTGAVTWTDTAPASSADCQVNLEAVLADSTLGEGEVTELVATVTNRTDAAVPTPVAILGVPGGLEPRHDQLKELVKAGTIAAYEVRGRDVVLYWRDLGAGKSVRVPVSLLAAVPGTYTGPASRAYLYYGDELKTWTAGARVTIAPKS